MYVYKHSQCHKLPVYFVESLRKAVFRLITGWFDPCHVFIDIKCE